MSVFVLGRHKTPFVRRSGKTAEALAEEAITAALDDAGLSASDVSCIIVASMLSPAHISARIADALGVTCPAFRVEAACASGGMAIHAAFSLTRDHDIVCVVGTECMSAEDDITSRLAEAGDGRPFPEQYADVARALDAPAALEGWATLMRHNAGQGAQLLGATIDYASEDVVCDPFRRSDCSPISDGAAAVILSRQHSGRVRITRSLACTDTYHVTDRTTPRFTGADGLASGLHNIDVAEVHDCFTVSGVLASPHYPQAVINHTGGLLSYGHAVGATGVRQLVDVVEWLEAHGGKGAVENIGGVGATCAIHEVASV